ncbi:MAG TPA: tyrosine--tRNA ligase [Caldisericia bacterium]|nr:MAG: Tyrosine--tRNA ligase [bacterium ADurb.Bin132]HNW31580.1 tyrosine--tRNA ligase [Caldisericia bacterium]HNY60947.1 tyrosine--tRNA ligase [Caldisericia bacterium]HOC78879.1 tyrosine--tRNA ligase [Caldisericia bacterium]HOG69666.1 tyrosine--tRNA ligase [Caldisericia bacterium]
MTRELELLKYGCAEIIPEDGLEQKLKLGRPLIIKLGADPTAPHLHLGHAVVLKKLRQFQDMGHKVIFVIGDYTAMIGDPSGRKETRKPLSEEQIKDSARTYIDQVIRVLEPQSGMVRFNSEWLSKLEGRDIVKLLAKFTVARVLERDDFTKRMKAEAPIYLHELLYVVFQAFDSVAIKADVEIGGTDQKFNFLAARELQKEMGMEPQVMMTMPILPGTDGVIKMSKSIGNTVDLLDEPTNMFGKLMSIPDSLIINYFQYAAFADPSIIQQATKDFEGGVVNPRDIKLMMAEKVVDIWHGEGAGKSCREEFLRVFSEHSLPSDIPDVALERDDYPIQIAKLLTKLELVPSTSEARRLVQSNAVKFDEELVDDPTKEIHEPKKPVLIKVGKRRYVRLVRRD